MLQKGLALVIGFLQMVVGFYGILSVSMFEASNIVAIVYGVLFITMGILTIVVAFKVRGESKEASNILIFRTIALLAAGITLITFQSTSLEILIVVVAAIVLVESIVHIFSKPTDAELFASIIAIILALLVIIFPGLKIFAISTIFYATMIIFIARGIYIMFIVLSGRSSLE